VSSTASNAWAVIIPVKPTAIGKSRLDLPTIDRVTVARAIALDTIAAAAACTAVAQVYVVTDDAALITLAFDIPGLRFVP
jgi:2-phospho-L-lactate guanylyltransferase